MYPEFIAIYVMLVIILVLLGFIVFLLMKLTKNGSGSSSSNTYGYNQSSAANQYYNMGQQYSSQPQPGQQHQASAGVVYCKRCTMPYDASQPYCPNCGTRR